MAERDLVRQLEDLVSGRRPDWLRLGIGDDAAVFDAPSSPLVATTDTVIEGVHFEPGTSMQLIGRKAVARSLSDLAAMAARPLCSLAAVCFNAQREGQCRALVHAIWQAADEMSAPLIGGDIASGAGRLAVVVTVLGVAGPKGVATRGGAQPGDAVCVTGELGGSILGGHLTFEPRIDVALALAERFDLHALIDISDGLSTDALHLAEASGRGLVLHAESIPISDKARQLAEDTGGEPLRHALDDGEDYELLFCLPAGQAREAAAAGVAGLAVTVIGEVAEQPSSWLVLADGARVPLRPGGWEHLKP